ncbi:MAG: transcription termination factor NusA [Dehalococcoidia bacterium]|nr:transcription termination factor NusA [Dehalococcoidia bacterium]
MKSDFLLAITQLAAEKGLSKETVLGVVESALSSAYRKNNFTPNQVVTVKISTTNGGVEVWAEKTVVKAVTDPRTEVSLSEAKKFKKDVKLGDILSVESTPQNAGRIAAQTAKQVILQRLHEAEHSAIFDEYFGKAGDIVSGVVRRTEAKQVFIDLGRIEAVMPATEQSPVEHLRPGQRLRVYLVEVAQSARGPMLVVSRSHPNLLRCLLELEVPEIFNGTVEIKSVAREAGYRSKVAVAAKQEGVDAVGCCVGLRGIRIQNIVSELGGEKIDVVSWSPDPAIFIANALAPAQVSSVKIDEKRETAVAVIPDKMLSLAIGKEGQNVRLAVRLTNWSIDIKSASDVEKEKAVSGSMKAEKDTAETIIEEGTIPGALEVPMVQTLVTGKPEKGLRFAEDILAPVSSDMTSGKDKKKKKKSSKEHAEDGIRLKRTRRGDDLYDAEDDI